MEEKQNKQLILFKIRDLRKKDQYKIDDAYINGYARVCKPVATAVYNSLCRHAEFNSQKAFPSQELIAYQHAISVRAVSRAIKKLAEYNIILVEIERDKGRFMNYVYTLLDKSEWKPINHRTKSTTGEPSDISRYRLATSGKCPHKDNKVLRITKFKDNKEDMSDKPTFSLKEEIEKLLTDQRRHIQIIGLWIQEMNLKPENQDQIQSIIHRNSRPAVLLKGYKNEDIQETIKILKRTEYLQGHFGIETISKYIDEVVANKKKQGPRILKWEEVRYPDGQIKMKPIYK